MSELENIQDKIVELENRIERELSVLESDIEKVRWAVEECENKINSLEKDIYNLR